jgi:hypothetical protein
LPIGELDRPETSCVEVQALAGASMGPGIIHEVMIGA